MAPKRSYGRVLAAIDALFSAMAHGFSVYLSENSEAEARYITELRSNQYMRSGAFAS
jgi:hypothetical protein